MKVSGAVLQAFINDLPDGWILPYEDEDDDTMINTDNINPTTIYDSRRLIIHYDGEDESLYEKYNDGADAGKLIREWRLKRDCDTFIVTCQKADSESLQSVIKQNRGKIS
jgi:hypothetical protein